MRSSSVEEIHRYFSNLHRKNKTQKKSEKQTVLGSISSFISPWTVVIDITSKKLKSKQDNRLRHTSVMFRKTLRCFSNKVRCYVRTLVKVLETSVISLFPGLYNRKMLNNCWMAVV